MANKMLWGSIKHAILLVTIRGTTNVFLFQPRGSLVLDVKPLNLLICAFGSLPKWLVKVGQIYS